MLITHTPSGPYLGVDLDRADTSAAFKTGTRARSNEGGEFIYCEFASAAVDCGVMSVDYDTTNDKWTATALTSTNGLRGTPVGVACCAVASGEFGWVQVFGAQGIRVAASCAANVEITTTATAGEADDAAGAGTKELHGMVLQVAAGASNNYPTDSPAYIVAKGTLAYPYVQDTN